jgi:ElaA protein
MSLEVAKASTETERAACLALRAEVFIDEQGVSRAEERDGRDGGAHHLLARLDGMPAGTLRMRIVEGAAKLERVCVRRALRGNGIGAALVRAALDLATTLPGVTEAKLGAQVPVIGFYERLGFSAHGPEYLDAGIPHRDMSRPLP